MTFKIDINKDGERCIIEAWKIKQSPDNVEMVSIEMAIGITFDVYKNRIEAITKI